MDKDVINNICVVRHAQGIFIKMHIFPEKDPKKRVPVGTVVFEENEARRVYAGLRAYFENTEYPAYLKIIDMRNMQKASVELKAKTESLKSEPLSAEKMQEENMRKEGRSLIREHNVIADAENIKSN